MMLVWSSLILSVASVIVVSLSVFLDWYWNH